MFRKYFFLYFCIVCGTGLENRISSDQIKNKFLIIPDYEKNIWDYYNVESSLTNETNFINRMHNLKRQFPDDDEDYYDDEYNNQDFQKAQKNCAQCSCGIANRRRIVGGATVRTNKYPWMVQMRYFGRFYCAGSLINDRYVLTAAHCTKGFQEKHITVRLLQYDQTIRGGIERSVSLIIRPYDYNIQTLDNDIALLKLSDPIPMNGYIRPVCLPPVGESFSEKTGIVSGWGATYQNGMPVNILHELKVPILSNDKCKKTVYMNRITSKMLCAGYLRGGKDACQGDSGGPLVVSNNQYFVQAGIVSWGYGCAQRNSPGVYTRVTKYVQWILHNTADACYCSKSK